MVFDLESISDSAELPSEVVDLLLDLLDYLRFNYSPGADVNKAAYEFMVDRLAESENDTDEETKSFSGRRMAVREEDFEDEEDFPQISYPKTPEEKTKIEGNLRDFYGCKNISIEQLDSVVDAFEPFFVTKGQYVIKQGADGRDFFVIDSGRYKVIRNGRVVKSFDGTGYFGEIALMYNTPRNASVKAVTEGKLWKITHSVYRYRIVSLAKKRDAMYKAALESNPIFDGIDIYDKIALINDTTQSIYKDGEKIFDEGDSGDFMCFVEDGQVRIEKKIDGKIRNIAEHKTGDYFGELALIDDKPRAASAFAVGQTRLGILTLEKFKEHMDHLKDVLEKNRKRYIDALEKKANLQ